MTPEQIPAALRDFAAAAAQSPDPARSVSELALLLAQLMEGAVAAVAAEADAMPARSGHLHLVQPTEHDELAFPPVEAPVDNLTADQVVPELIEAAQAAAGLTAEQWAELGETEQAHAIQVAQQLAQRTAEA